MKRHRTLWTTLTGLGLFALLLAGALSMYTSQAHADGNPQDGANDRAVVEHYFQIFNAGLATTNASNSDKAFDMLASVYAPDATFIQSNSKNVVAVRHGVNDIIAYYKTSFGYGAPPHGAQFVPDTTPRDPNNPDATSHPPIRSLAPHVVISYEVATPPGFSQGGYCMHVFTLQGGMIESLDWATYYGPVK